MAERTALHPDAQRKLRVMAIMHGYLACLLIFTIWAVTCLERDDKGEHSASGEEVASHARLLQQTRLDAAQEAWDHIPVRGETNRDVSIEVAWSSSSCGSQTRFR